MKAELDRILDLQREYQSRLSPAMKERGRLIRGDLPDQLSELAGGLAVRMGVEDFFAEGGDGTGLHTRVPWVRFGSRFQAPRATDGFYVVFLFDALGRAAYLSLNQGTTDFNGGDFVPKPRAVIADRVTWARAVLSDWLPRVGSPAEMDLADANLGAGYERGNVVARMYQADRIPDDQTLFADLQTFAEGLGWIYRARANQPIPGEEPEVNEAEESAQSSVGRSRNGSGAGFRTNAAEIKLVEERAVAIASAYYRSTGWSVEERGKPFDLRVRRNEDSLDVEVKGTTSDGAGVPLTRGEVRHHESAYPHNALVVVRGILLDRSSVPRVACGGVLYEHRAWKINPADLRVISYAYTVPRALYQGAGTDSESLL